MPLSISGHSRIEAKLSNEINSSCSVRLSKYGIYAPGIQFTICLVHACVAIGAGLTDSRVMDPLAVCMPGQSPAQCATCSGLLHDAEAASY